MDIMKELHEAEMAKKDREIDELRKQQDALRKQQEQMAAQIQKMMQLQQGSFICSVFCLSLSL